MPVPDLVEKILAALPPSRACNLPPEVFCIRRHGIPRWIVPPGPQLRSLLASWSPYRLSSRIFWGTVQAAQRLGVTGLLPPVNKVSLGDHRGINWQAVGWRGSVPPVPVIYIGTPGPRQKAVLHLVDTASSQCRAIVKVPLGSDAGVAILREADVLRCMADETWVAAPRVIHVDESRGVTTQTFVDGRSGGRTLSPGYLVLLHALMLPGEHISLAEYSAPWREHGLFDLLCSTDRNTVRSALAELEDDNRLPAFWVHGDFAPWNIRDRDQLAPALIDWEMAERGGLPLLDGYHFLHMQSFLFGATPRSHAAEIEAFARSMGISADLCQKLEIAYLAQSYLACAAWEEQRRARFLLQTLAVVVQERARAVARCGQRALHLVASRPPSQAATRSELFSALISTLDREQVPYCVLSGHEPAAAVTGSDVDIMFHPQDLSRVPGLLERCAHSAGAHLVQCLEHETSACYYVLARAEGRHVAHLAVDCYGDYRRDNRTWLQAEAFLSRRRRHREFFRPAIDDEFIYRLIKKVLKQSFTAEHLKQLQHLFARHPVGCHLHLSGIWQPQTTVQLERAIVERNLDWFQQHLPELLVELHRSSKLRRHSTVRERLRGLRRITGRILKPTGLVVSVSGPAGAPTEEVADSLLRALTPVFRRSMRPSARMGPIGLLRQLLNLRFARLRSTLIVVTDDATAQPPAGSLGRKLLERLIGPDLVLHLDGSLDRRSYRDDPRDIRLTVATCRQQLFEESNRVVLDFLAQRTAKRLRLPERSSRRCRMLIPSQL